jgi:uncharacterized membrane protein YsdA (DUF1294 family)
VSDLLVKSVLTAGAFAGGALTIFAYKYPKAYFKFYCILIWVLAGVSIMLATLDGNIEHAYQVQIP